MRGRVRGLELDGFLTGVLVAVPPADFLVGLATAYLQWGRTEEKKDDSVRLGRLTQLLPAAHIADDTPELFGAWIIHKAGFRAPHILEVARW